MINHPDGYLHIYMLSVGQGDTTVIVSPGGSIIVVDAVKTPKVKNFLKQLDTDGTIEHLIVTHPHDDHYGACSYLALNYKVNRATLAPFWHIFGMGPPGYCQLVGRLEAQDTDINFLSGYSRWYPDDLMSPPSQPEELASGDYDPEVDYDRPFLEMLGPTNEMVQCLKQASVFDTNHLSIMSRLTWKRFRMIIAGDAQMENWDSFDKEQLLEDKCQVLRAAHHGSKNGTQWERIERLNPSIIIISSDFNAGDKLPDLCGSSIFAKFDSANDKFAAITGDTGSIYLRVSLGGTRRFRMMGESYKKNVNLQVYKTLSETENPTDWQTLLRSRVDQLFGPLP